MCNTNQDRRGCAAVTSKPQIPMACDKCLLAHRIHPGQVGRGSFRCRLPSKTRLDGGGSIPNISSLTAKGNPYAGVLTRRANRARAIRMTRCNATETEVYPCRGRIFHENNRTHHVHPNSRPINDLSISLKSDIDMQIYGNVFINCCIALRDKLEIISRMSTRKS